MSKEQTFRSEDRSASEKAAAVSAVRNDIKQMEATSRRQKDFETKHSGVFAAPGLHSLSFNCGIRVKTGSHADEQTCRSEVGQGATCAYISGHRSSVVQDEARKFDGGIRDKPLLPTKLRKIVGFTAPC